MTRKVRHRSSPKPHEHVMLSERDSLRVLDLLEKPPAPTDNLIRAAAACKDRTPSLLRTMLDNSIEKSGVATEEEIDAALEAKATELAKGGL